MKRIQVIFLISGVITLISLAIPIYLMFWGPDHIELTGKTVQDFYSGDDWIPIIVIPIVIIIIIACLVPFYRIIFPPQIKNGERAKATILRVWDTGTTINDDPQIGLLLEAKTKEGMNFQAETKTIVSRLSAALVQPGITTDIIYDPQNTKRIQVVGIEAISNGGSSIEGRLTQILELRNKGLLTEEEYQKKREEIIKSI